MTFLKKKSQKICKVYKKPLTLQPLSWIQSFYLKEANTYWDWNVRTVKWGRFLFYIPFAPFRHRFIPLLSYTKNAYCFPWFFYAKSYAYAHTFLGAWIMGKRQRFSHWFYHEKTDLKIVLVQCLFRAFLHSGKCVVPEVFSLVFLLVFYWTKKMQTYRTNRVFTQKNSSF